MTVSVHAARPRLRQLEDRTVPAPVVGLTTGNALVQFDTTAPAKVLSTVQVTGLQDGENLLGIDFRPATGTLYGLGSSNRVYVIDPAGGKATALGSGAAFTPGLAGGGGAGVGFDFNPAADKIRVVAADGQNLRLNPDTGAVAASDPALFYDPANVTNQGFFGSTVPAPQVAATAYTKNVDPGTGKTVTTQYVVDAGQDILAIQGGPDGNPSPNTGGLVAVDALTTVAGQPLDITAETAFDIEAGTDMGFLARAVGTGTELYMVNLATATAAPLGTVGGQLLRGLAVLPAAPGAGTIQLGGTTFAFPANRTPVAVTVTRTGGSTGPVTVLYSTADGTAVAGTDYLPVNGALTFEAGQTTQQIFLQVPAGAPPARPATAFSLVLTAPGGGAALGTATTATISIPATPPPTLPPQPPPVAPPGSTAPPGTGTAPGAGTPGTPTTPAILTRFFAAGAGQGGEPRVNVYDAVTGAQAFSFLAYEQSFTGGVTVATGDVDGDGVDDVAVGSGVGGGPRVVVFSGATRKAVADFFAYEPSFRGGVNVALGDVNGDGAADVLVGSGVGGAPRVRVVSGAGLLTAAANTLADPTTQGAINLADFFAYESTFRGGVTVAAREFTGDGLADLVAGSGQGGGPRVRIIDAAQAKAAGPDTPSLADFFAYDSAFRDGVFVAAGDVNGDGRQDVVTGSGAGGGPDVRAFTGRAGDGKTGVPIGNFFAFDPGLRAGVRVAADDLNADGIDDLIAAAGAGAGTTGRVRVFSITGAEIAGIQAFDQSFTGGVNVG